MKDLLQLWLLLFSVAVMSEVFWWNYSNMRMTACRRSFNWANYGCMTAGFPCLLKLWSVNWCVRPAKKYTLGALNITHWWNIQPEQVTWYPMTFYVRKMRAIAPTYQNSVYKLDSFTICLEPLTFEKVSIYVAKSRLSAQWITLKPWVHCELSFRSHIDIIQLSQLKNQ